MFVRFFRFLVAKRRHILGTLLSVCLLLSGGAWADPGTLNLGVFAYRPKPIMEKRFQPLADYLSQQLGHTRVQLMVLEHNELEQALQQGKLDLVFTNPSHYVYLRAQNNFTGALATLVSLESGTSVQSLGGVIISRRSNSSVYTVRDLRGQTIGVPSTRSLGGYQTQLYEAQQQGIDLLSEAKIQNIGTHDGVVEAVLSGKVDAGFIRTGVIEEMTHEGKLDAQQLRIINEQNFPHFPFRTSTRLYPEWAFVALPHVDSQVVRKIASSLLALDERHPAAKAAAIGGFAPPGDYLPVENLARSLHMPPYDQATELTLAQVWYRWQSFWLSLIGLALLALGYTARRLHLDNTALKSLEASHALADQELRIAAAAFDSHEGMFVTDGKSRILKVNAAFTTITGFAPEEVIGSTPRMLSSGLHDGAFFADIWRQINTTGTWRGEIWNRRKNGEIFPCWVTFSRVLDDQGELSHFVTAFSDITERKANEEEVRRLAFYDPLTLLPNRRLMRDRLERAILASHRTGQVGAIMFIDLDNFKRLNDSHGHSMGDLLLKQVAERLTQSIRETDTVARLGGDEFVVILENLAPQAEAAALYAEGIGEQILRQLNYQYALGDLEHHSTPSIGVALFGTEEDDIDDLMRRADLAMYEAKRAGRNTLCFYDPLMQARITEQNEMEAALLRALLEEQFSLYYQPQVTPYGRVIGAECLLRWQHPTQGMISPARFIPVAEQCGLIVPIGFWVLRAACEQLGAWKQIPHFAELTLSVNVSVRQFSMPSFVDEVTSLLESAGVHPSKLKLELTESLLLDNTDEAIKKMNQLRDIGVRFSLDDFGTGYSSLAYLKRLPLEQIKIDQSFVRDLEHDENDAIICAAIIRLAHSLGCVVVAEGVETNGQRDFLIEQNACDYLQGYLYSRPVPVSEFEPFCQQTVH